MGNLGVVAKTDQATSYVDSSDFALSYLSCSHFSSLALGRLIDRKPHCSVICRDSIQVSFEPCLVAAL
jgi:hypothetical protein